MRFYLKNEELKIELDSKGAELLVIEDKEGQNYLWHGDATFWGRRSPVLFPFIGRLKNSLYTYKGKEYKVGPHGFARDMEFSLISSTDTEIWLQCRDTEETYQLYPFHFSLKIGYALDGRKLKVSWEVKNLDNEDILYFSIGAHPGFYCPLTEEEEGKAGYFLDFGEKREELSYQFADLTTGLLLKEKKKMQLDKGRIKLTKEFFDESTYLFLDKQLDEVSLVRPDGRKYVSLYFDMPILAIWSPEKMNAPFVCLEPWYGCCDGEWFEGSLEEREWGNSLPAGKIFKNSYTMEFCSV